MPSRIVIKEPKPGPSVLITRFDAQQRAQHILMIASVFILALTGLPMKYSTYAISSWWISVWHGMGNIRSVHHYAAWVMIATCAYHLMYIIVSRPFSTAMFPKLPGDLIDFFKDVTYTLRLRKEPPQFDRYSYRNKAAYWLAYPGSIIMIATGLVLLYPTGMTSRLPGWTLPLSLMVHSDLAVLTIGWIICVHMYFAHFSTQTFPFDKAVLTGKVPVERYRHEFPREYRRIMAAEGSRVPRNAHPPVPEAEEYAEFEESLSEEESPADRPE